MNDSGDHAARRCESALAPAVCGMKTRGLSTATTYLNRYERLSRSSLIVSIALRACCAALSVACLSRPSDAYAMSGLKKSCEMTAEMLLRRRLRLAS